MLSEISQSQKNRYYMIVQVSRIIKTIEKESRMVVARSWGEEEIESYYLMGIELQLYMLKTFSQLVIQHCGYT